MTLIPSSGLSEVSPGSLEAGVWCLSGKTLDISRWSPAAHSPSPLLVTRRFYLL
uniref:Uncharacterized protein n=1 Tax=Nothoprocta perdicaria TaxID=30464 RepID=A0A8C6ZK06_NOTPE